MNEIQAVSAASKVVQIPAAIHTASTNSTSFVTNAICKANASTGALENPEELSNSRYKIKCARLERQIKECVFINAAIDAEVKDCKRRLETEKVKRKVLLKKLLSHQEESSQDPNHKLLHQTLQKCQSKSSKL